MKTQLLSIFDGWFNTGFERSESNSTKIFLTYSGSGRTLMIEEEAYTVWAYVLKPDKEGIDFDGFLCAVTDPKGTEEQYIEDATKGIKDKPIPALYVTKHCFVKNLKKKHIKIEWSKDRITILIKKKIYLIMDLIQKESYSRGLRKDCQYGKPLVDLM